MTDCSSCGDHVPSSNCKTVNPCDPVQPPCKVVCVDPLPCEPQKVCIPECRKSVKDDCRIKPCPPCDCVCPPKVCVRKTKCKFYSVKDACRQNKPCPPVKKCCTH